MVAEQKTKEAEYFLDKITQAMTRDFVPNLSAFLSATRSIPDITKIRDEDEARATSNSHFLQGLMKE